jgi:hypothetical protein
VPRNVARACAVVAMLAACHNDFAPSKLSSVGESGVVRTSDGGFSFAFFPCLDDEISGLQLGTARVVNGEAVDLTTMLSVEFDPPRSARQLLFSTATEYQASLGEHVVTLDRDALDRFNSDRDFLTDFDFDEYLTMSAWSGNGDSLPIGGSLSNRFDAEIGEVRTSDFVGPVENVTCADGSRAWPAAEQAST